MMEDNYDLDDTDIAIMMSSEIDVYSCVVSGMVTMITKTRNGSELDMMCLKRKNAIATARAILKQFGEGLE